MDESIIMSARNGRFEKINQRGNESSMLDISAMVAMPEKERKGKAYRVQNNQVQSQAAKNGQFTRILTGLKPVEEMEDGKQTDPDLKSS